jgi:hypothetical protein
MKRFHVHAHVENLQSSIEFYARMFGTPPTRVEDDYAKWMLEDPRLNFAISTRGTRLGVDHLGIQTDTEEELTALKARAQAAQLALHGEGETSCCYARSEKYWVTDPQGIAWEQFNTLADIPLFGETRTSGTSSAACCPPAAARGAPVAIPVNAAPAKSCC